MLKSFAVAALAFALLLTACSDTTDLNRPNAKRILSEFIGHPIALADPVVFVSVGHFSETGDLDGYCDDPLGWPVEVTEGRQQRMQIAGIIRVTKRGCNWEIALTDLGKTYAGGPPSASGLQMIRVASYSGWDVTSVEQKGLDARVQISAYFALNEAGAALQAAGFREDGVIGEDPRTLVQSGEQDLVLVAGSWRVVPVVSTGAN